MKKNAFTLIEMMVVIIIIMILSTILFSASNIVKDMLALQRTSSKLSQDIRRIQEMSLSARDFQGSPSMGGYGIHVSLFDSQKYYLFADTNDNGVYDAPAELLEEVFLEKEVEIGDIFPVQPINITFVPPNPNVLRDGFSTIGDFRSLAVYLRLKDYPAKIVKVNVISTGLIYTE